MSWTRELAILATSLCGGVAAWACIRESERITRERGPWRSDSCGMFMLGCIGVPIATLVGGVLLLGAIK